MPMFDNERFITEKIASILPVCLQAFLWDTIDNLKQDELNHLVSKVDYLQIFTFTYLPTGIKIIHTQESPKYERIYSFDYLPPLAFTNTIYVIDDSTHSTMLFSDE